MESNCLEDLKERVIQKILFFQEKINDINKNNLDKVKVKFYLKNFFEYLSSFTKVESEKKVIDQIRKIFKNLIFNKDYFNPEILKRNLIKFKNERILCEICFWFDPVNEPKIIISNKEVYNYFKGKIQTIDLDLFKV